MDSNIFKHFALLAVLAYWPAAIYMTKTYKGSMMMSFSKHAASQRHAYILFAIAVSLESILYLIFLTQWFVPNFKIGQLFNFLVFFILLGHWITGIVPETAGLSRIIHRYVSYGVAVLFIPTTLLLALAVSVSFAGRVTAAIALLAMAAVIVYGLTMKQARSHFLVLQAVYIATLPIVLVAITYMPRHL